MKTGPDRASAAVGAFFVVQSIQAAIPALHRRSEPALRLVMDFTKMLAVYSPSVLEKPVNLLDTF
jgi:hypothetical protein